MDDQPLLRRSSATISNSIPRSSSPIHTSRVSAVSVAGTAIGSTVSMTYIACAFPIRCRRAGRVNLTRTTRFCQTQPPGGKSDTSPEEPRGTTDTDNRHHQLPGHLADLPVPHGELPGVAPNHNDRLVARHLLRFGHRKIKPYSGRSSCERHGHSPTQARSAGLKVHPSVPPERHPPGTLDLVSRPGMSKIPTGPVAVPAAVRALAGTGSIAPVWRNGLGGLTFRIDDRWAGTRYAKWVAAGTPEIDLAREAERLVWAHRWTTVPRVIEHGADADGAWLLTAAVPGRSAVDHRWIADPPTAAAAIGEGLRRLHDALPVDQCPFDWSISRRRRRVDERIADGGGPADWFPEHQHLALAEAQARIDQPPAIDRLVVCHGDACAPNTLLHDDGTFAAHVDVGSLGVADRWADLAVAAWSTEWNYGRGYDDIVYDAYGIARDPARTAYYRLLWDMS